MSKIFDLINELCPQGVEFRELGEIGYFYGGLNGKTKDDFVKHGNVKYITYMNVFSNLSIDLNALEFVKIENNERQNLVAYGDVLFTGSSETRNECGFSSVLTKKPEEPIYLNSFCFGFRLNDLSLFEPEFLKYIFRSKFLRAQIIKTANGVTRFNISKTKFQKIKLPVPPLEVQREIVRILDCFTLLTAELTAELTARKKQYEFYRDFLLSFDELNKNGGYELKTLRSIADYSSDRIKFDSLNELNYVGVENLLQNKAGKVSSKYVPASGNCTKFESGDILIGNIRPYLKKIWQADCTGGASGDVLVLRLNDESVNSRYLYQILADDKFFDYNMKNAKGAKMPRGNKNAILEYKIPVPSLPTQRKIVEVLDKFDTLVNSIAEGLPCEIKLRQKQYEYYRERLLSFTEIKKEI